MINFFKPPSLPDPEENRKAGIVHNQLLNSLIILDITMIILLFLLPWNNNRWLTGGVIINIFSLGMLVLNNKGYTRITSLIYVAVFMLTVIGFAWTAGGISAPIIQFLPIVVLSAGFMYNWRVGLFTGAISILVCIGLVYADYSGLIPASIVVPNRLSLLAISLISITFLLASQYNVVESMHRIMIQLGSELKNREEAENALSQSEELRKRVFEGSKIPIVIMDPDTLKYISCNSAAIKYYGYPTLESTLGRTPLDVSAPVQYDGTPSYKKAKYYTDKALEDGNVTFEWLHRRPDGELWDAEVHLLNFESDGKNLLQFYLIDITERKKAEKELKQSEEKYKTLMENMNEVVMMVDNEDRVRYVNRKFTEILGYKPEEVIGEIGYMLLSDPKDREIIINADFNRKEKVANQYEITFSSKDGKKTYFLVSSAPIVKPDGLTEGFIIAMVDITTRKLAEDELDSHKNHLEQLVNERTLDLETINEELKATNEELYLQHTKLETALNKLKEAQTILVHSEKMASLGVLAAGVAHEINNPLNFINGGVTGLETYFNENLKGHKENVAFMIEAIQVGVKRAADIVTSLNHFSRSDDMPNTECNIHIVIDNCLVMLNNRIKNRIEVIKEYNAEPNSVLVNEGRIHQVFLNILVNAVQAITNNGTISITSFNKKDRIVIEISDTGCGINEDIMPKIMDPFFTTKDPGKGTGLGLSITYDILRGYNGSIEFESKKDSGTKAIITLPLSKH